MKIILSGQTARWTKKQIMKWWQLKLGLLFIRRQNIKKCQGQIWGSAVAFSQKEKSIFSDTGLRQNDEGVFRIANRCKFLGAKAPLWLVRLDSAWYFLILPDTAWYCLILSDTAWYCPILNDIACYCLILLDTAWYCFILPDTTWYCLIMNDTYLYFLDTAWYYPILPDTA